MTVLSFSHTKMTILLAHTEIFFFLFANGVNSTSNRRYACINMISSGLVRLYCEMFISDLTRSSVLGFGRKQMSSSLFKSFKITLFP